MLIKVKRAWELPEDACSRDDLVDKTHSVCALRTELFGGDQETQRRSPAQHVKEPQTAAPAGDDAVGGLTKGENRFGDRQPEMAGGQDLAAATVAAAVDRGDDDAWPVKQAIEQGLHAMRHGEHVLFFLEGREIAEITT